MADTTKPSLSGPGEILRQLLLEQFVTEAGGPKPPDTLFHYTNAAGFQGILSLQQLYLTHSAYLNDQRELSYPVGLAAKVIRTLREADGEQAHRGFWVNLAISSEAHSKDEQWYVGSLSINGDQLCQWRAYTPNGGYSIGLKTATLAIEMAGNLGPVIYQEAEQVAGLERLVVRLLNKWKVGLAGATGSDAVRFNGDFFAAAAALLTRTFIFWKSPAFAGEEEWRVAQSDWGTRKRFQVRGDLLTPYRILDLPATDRHVPLNRVYVSPLGDQSLARLSAELFMESLGYSAGLIRTTDIALRSRR